MSARPSPTTGGADGDGPMPIAVVGMSCRLSGIATNPEGLWQMLSRGLTGWSNNGSSRFQMDAFWHPQADFNGSVSKDPYAMLLPNPISLTSVIYSLTHVGYI